MTLLQVRNLHVRFRARGAEVHAVRGISLDVAPGEVLGLVGESGSGKSQAMMAVMGLLSPDGRAEGSARFRGEELIGLGERALNRHRGAGLAMIFQEPMTALDPLFTVGHQLGLALRLRAGLGRRAARERVLDLLAQVGLPGPERPRAYPHELSGGQRQRVMIALALATNPALLIADEPTTALDATIQAQILDLLAEQQARLGLALVLVTHDLRLVRRYADRTSVMRGGEIVESGPTRTLFARPAHPYTRALIAAEPHGEKPRPPPAPTVLEARDVTVAYAGRPGLFRASAPFQAVDGVSLHVRAGETVAVVGESGSGKSTLGRALLRLQPASGSIRFEGQELTALDARALRPLRRHMQIVFQDPFGSLSPRLTAGEIVTEGLSVHEPGLTRAERDRHAASAFEEVGLDPLWRGRFPHEFSGGQRQRLAIARAIILEPKLVVLDEPTSALDRSVQARIVALLLDLQRRHGLAYLFISHDLGTVRAISDRVAVMRAGRIAEEAATRDIFDRPREAYTRELIAASRLG